NPIGLSSFSPGMWAPTAAGYSNLAGLSGLSQTNLGVLKQYLPAAPAAQDVTTVKGVSIPIGPAAIVAPSYTNLSNWVGSSDYNISDHDQLRLRLVANRSAGLDSSAGLPAFYGQ